MRLVEHRFCYTRLERMEGKYLEAALREIHWGGHCRSRHNVFGVQVVILLHLRTEAEA